VWRQTPFDEEIVFRTFRLALVAMCIIHAFSSLHTILVLDSDSHAAEINPITRAMAEVHPLLLLFLPPLCLILLCWAVFRWDRLVGLMAAGGCVGIAVCDMLLHVFMKSRGVSVLVGVTLLIILTVVGTGLVLVLMERIKAPSIPPQTVIQVWTNYPGYGGVAIVHASGEGINNAYRADVLEETPMGTLLENIRWESIELRVNGVAVENEIDMALVTGEVESGVNPLPAEGEALAISFEQGFLKVGDEVEVIYKPLGYKMAEATIPEPQPGRQYVDTGIQLRAARLLGRKDETVSAMKNGEFAKARELAYEMEAIVRDIHDNWLANSEYLENDLWELNRYMGDLVDENLCKTLIIIYERDLPYLINALELIETIIYNDLHADDPVLLASTSLEQIENAAYHSKMICENVGTVENLRKASKYYDHTKTLYQNMEILYAIPGGFIQDLSRDLYLPFIVPWVEDMSLGIKNLSGHFYLKLRVYNLGTVRVENIVGHMYVWLENEEGGRGEDKANARFWPEWYFEGTEEDSKYTNFKKIRIEDNWKGENALIPTSKENESFDMWQMLTWNFGWPRFPLPTKMEGQYWWVEEQDVVERLARHGVTYDLTENNNPIIEYFFHKTGTVYAPYVGEGKPPVKNRGGNYLSEGGKAVFAGDPLVHSNAVWERRYLNPGGDYFTVTYDGGTDFLVGDWGSLDTNAQNQMQLADFYLYGYDTVWNKKQELSAWAVGYMGSVC